MLRGVAFREWAIILDLQWFCEFPFLQITGYIYG